MMRFIFALLAGAILAGCFTTAAKQPESGVATAKQAPKVIAYDVKQGPWVAHNQPLPAEQNVFIDWYYSDGSVVRQRAYRGWDFNADGRFDMLEALDAERKTSARLFDFTGNGKIDLERQHE